jgi:hypothetical protein
VKKSLFLGLIALLLLTSCQSGAQPRSYTKGDPLHTYDFTGTGSFEEGIYDAASLSIVNGVYQIDVTQGDNVLWWGQWGDTYDNTVIDVDTEQQSEPIENAYGVMCRASGEVGQNTGVDPTLAAIMEESTPEAGSDATAEATSDATDEVESAATEETATDEAEDAATDEVTAAVSDATADAAGTDEPDIALTLEVTSETTAETSGSSLTATPEPTEAAFSQGDGYVFLIQGGGSFAIMRARGRQLTPLVDWTTSDVIQRGPARNHIRAVCLGNYLALYVNDQFLGSATDDTYARGQVGLAASAANRLGTRIVFDNLTVSVASQ